MDAVALVTDIVLYEEYPSRYHVYARRLRRWIRGDWQLLPWLFPIVHTEKGMAPNRLSTINKWKIFDNLRRSLLPPMLVALLAAGWLFLPGAPWVWTLLVLLPSALPVAVQTVHQGRHNIGRLTLKQVFEPSRFPFVRWALAVLFLPYEALLMLGAISTTLIRLLIERRNLLQWTTAANAARSRGLNALYETWWEMAGSLILNHPAGGYRHHFQCGRFMGGIAPAGCLADRSPNCRCDQPACYSLPLAAPGGPAQAGPPPGSAHLGIF